MTDEKTTPVGETPTGGTTPGPTKPNTATPDKEDGKVMVDKAQLDNLISDMRDMKKQLANANSPDLPILRKRVKERTAYIKLWSEVKISDDNKRIVKDYYVIGWEGDSWDAIVIDPKTRKEESRLFINAILRDMDGKEETRTIDQKKLSIESKPITVKILKTDTEEIVEEQGLVEVTEVKDFATVGTGVRVPMENIILEQVSTIEFPDGAKIKINNKFLNAQL